MFDSPLQIIDILLDHRQSERRPIHRSKRSLQSEIQRRHIYRRGASLAGYIPVEHLLNLLSRPAW